MAEGRYRTISPSVSPRYTPKTLKEEKPKRQSRLAQTDNVQHVRKGEKKSSTIEVHPFLLKNRDICQVWFSRGVCSDSACRQSHDTARLPICREWAQGQCPRLHCRFRHFANVETKQPKKRSRSRSKAKKRSRSRSKAKSRSRSKHRHRSSGGSRHHHSRSPSTSRARHHHHHHRQHHHHHSKRSRSPRRSEAH